MKPQKPLPFQHITIIGVGLIGGSLALAIKQRFPAIHITGVDTPRVLKRALSRHAIDLADKSIERSVRSADLVILAAPVSSISKILPRVAKNCSPNTIVTDTGSVKRMLSNKHSDSFRTGTSLADIP
jgi:prephenate dehydrogenase